MSFDPRRSESLVHLLRRRATDRPAGTYFRFLHTGDVDGPSIEVTWGQIDLEARRIAARLQQLQAPGQRALLLYPPGAAFIAAFYGCLYARVVAVPAYPPDPSRLVRTLPRLRAIVEDADARLVLAPASICMMARSLTTIEPRLTALQWVPTDTLAAPLEDEWQLPAVDRDSLALLQYTSGSTGAPMGVRISHGNLLHNSEVIRRSFGHPPGTTGVGWLPMYHDMGLVGLIIQPAYADLRVTLMSPLDFLRRPSRWLEAITRTGAYTSGGPDFAYRLCLTKIGDDVLARLDLSSWRVAFSGAEPVRAETLEAFADRFASCGFDRRAFYPTYGLAESTLMAAGATEGPRAPRYLDVDAGALERGRIAGANGSRWKRLVSCGPVADELEAAIVDPATGERRGADEVGEIWLRGESVAAGYWREEDDQGRFHARLPEGGGWLRTGDLGFVRDGELYIVGRRKDLLILRGRNVHPHDIEHAVQEASPRVRPGSVAAFGLEVAHEERAVVAAEIDERGDGLAHSEVIRAIRARVGEAVGVELHAVALVRRGTIPKTSSGKIQRHAAKAAWMAGELEVVAHDESRATRAASAVPQEPPRTLEAAIEAIATRLGDELGIPVADIDVRAPMSSFGLGSLQLVELTTRLEELFQRPLETLTLFSYPTVEALATFLTTREGARAPASAAGGSLAAAAGLYVDLEQACARIERRSTRYQFDLERDIAWAELDAPGLYLPDALLDDLGFDVASLKANPAAWDVLQWAMAVQVCAIFELFEFGVVYFARNDAARLGHTRSIALLADEEDKHIQLFRRYARHLRAQRPALAQQLDALSRDSAAAIVALLRGTADAEPRAQHYAIWLQTLFFEEYTVYLDQCLREAEGVQPAWRSAHAAHRREEIQHIATDVRYLGALDLDEAERYRLSAAFVARLLQGFDRQLGLEGPRRLLEALHPAVRVMIDDPHRAERCMQRLLGRRAFAHSWKAAPFFRELTRTRPAALLPAADRASREPEVPRHAPAGRAEPIAIVGVGCRFPGSANSADALWELLLAGTDAVTEVPRERWDVDAYYDPDPAAVGKMYTRWGGFVDHIQSFDHAFFGITPREARNMDPQQRMLLEVSWEALEHAGIPPSTLAGSSASVFVGICSTDYSHRTVAEPINAYSGTGTAFSVAAGRISYTLGLNGPCMAVDTACSSSLVAVHQACRALEAGESSLSIVAGVNAILAPKSHVFFSALRAMSPVGQCKTFDAAADGYVRAEGCGVVILKRLGDAQRDGDRILAVIRGTAVNQDGRSNGLTAPSGLAQEAVMRTALARAGLRAADVDYVEAHGTGTPLGDPIELQAIGAAHRGRDNGPVKVGSIKTQIGHCEGAAGIAGLIKAVLIAERGVIPGNLHFRQPTPHVPWSELPVEVVTGQRPLERARRIAINSFGFGGTNAHAVVEPAPVAPLRSRALERTAHPIVVSGRSEQALADNIGRVLEALGGCDEAALPDVAHTLAAGREHHPRRVAFMAAELESARQRLAELARAPAPAPVGEAPRVALLFTGQGAQYPGMGRELYETHPRFRAVIDEVATYLDPLLDRPLRSLLFDDAAALTDTLHAQPTLFAVELATAALWREWGVVPEVVLGHSLGELAAACFAGVMSLADAAELVATRARLMQALPRDGAMISISTDEASVREAIAPYGPALSIAAVNAATQVVISGDVAAAAEVARRMAALGIETRPLAVSHAFHSEKMRPVLAPLRELVAGIGLEAPWVPLVSTVDPGLPASALQRGEYWVSQVMEPVRFADALAVAVARGVDTLVEVGPSPALLGLAGKGPSKRCLLLPSMRPRQSDWSVLGGSLCRLHVRGAAVDWQAFDAPFSRRRVTLPSYAFQRQRCWLEEAPGLAPTGRPAAHPLLGVGLDVAGREAFETTLTLERAPWLTDHRVAGSVVVPAAAWLELLLAAAREATGSATTSIAGVEIQRALLVGDAAPRIQLVVRGAADALEVEAFSRGAGGDARWISHARARVVRELVAPTPALGEPTGPLEAVDTAGFYAELAAIGLEYGPCFRGLRSLGRAEARVVADVALPDGVAPWSGRCLHPSLLDAALQAAGALFVSGAALMLPVAAQRYAVWADAPGRATVVVTRNAEGTIDVLVHDDEGRPLAAVGGLVLRPADASAFRRRPARDEADASLVLRWDASPSRDEAGAVVGRWLVVGADALAHAVAERLGRAAEVTRAAADDVHALDVALADPQLAGVVYVAPAGGDPAALAPTLEPALRLARSLLARPVRLALVTRGAQTTGSATDGVPAAALPGTSLWGLGRTLAEEAPSLRCRMVDLDPVMDDGAAAAALLAELGRTDDEPQVCLRGDRRLVARLVRAQDGRLPRPAGPSWTLVLKTAGALDSLALVAAERPKPGPGQVEIAVEAAGLNFRDVLGALGMLRGFEAPLGGELAGRVTAVGEGVTSLSLGDPVMGLAPSAFARHVVTDARLVIRRPRALALDASAAATIPVAFLTAWYGLYELAALRPGERVLVHAAAGGVGMAAVQLARRIGAEVLGTASPGKQAAVRALGAAHVASSREPGFAAEILRHTAGKGVDVVLNSLTGELLRESFTALGEGGRFIEIGKTELLDPSQVGALHPTARYQAFDLLELPPAHIQRMLAAVAAALEAGEITPLPRRAFGISAAVQAFRTMARAQHVGKIVLTSEDHELALAAEGTWLVTGGLGALGRHVAGALVERGARQLVLVARRPPQAERVAFVERLREAGARVEVVVADVARRDEVEALVDTIARTMPPLQGVVHAAGVLDDAPLAEQSWERFTEVLAPKAMGAWWLHEATKALPLQAFVLFSSVAGSLGSAGQGSYAAANAFLDGLAHHRRAAGLAALSIGWGPWAGEGMASRLGARQQQRIANAGLRTLEPAEGLRWLVQLLQGDAPHVIVAPLDRPRLSARIGTGPVPPLLSLLVEARGAAAGPSLTEALARVAPAARQRRLVALLQERAAVVMGAASGDVDPRKPLLDLGLDSLMAVDLHHGLARELDRPLPETLLFDHPTLERLAGYLLHDVLGMAPADADADADPGPQGLEALSEADATTLLEQELGELEGLL